MNDKETYILLPVLQKYEQSLERISLFICILPKKSYFRMLQVILDAVNLFRGGTNFAIVFGDDVIMTIICYYLDFKLAYFVEHNISYQPCKF